jgi:hypothetical protein
MDEKAKKGQFPDLYDELFTLRKLERPTGSISLSATPTLVEVLGNGDITVARNEFVHILKGLSLGDRDVMAYTLSILGHGNVQERLVAAAQQMFIDDRHVRRLGDAGIKKVANFIGSFDIRYRPLALVTLVGDEEEGLAVLVDVHCLVNPEFGTFALNGEEWKPEIEQIDHGEGMAYHYRVEPAELRGSDGQFALTHSRVTTFRVTNDYRPGREAVEVVTTPRGGLQVSFVPSRRE